jgi:aldehyde dehydrogenase (NAD+)
MRIAAAVARNLTPTLFELGGKSANVVFADANIENAVKAVSSGIFSSCGQACVAGSRAVVARSIYDQFVEGLIKTSAHVRIGDPKDVQTQLGPLGTHPQYQKVLKYIDIGKDEGAEVVLGGKVPEPGLVGQGWFVEPTIFRGAHNRMRIAQEEIFGPILSVIPFDDDDEAIAIANDIPFGLAGGVWSGNISRAMHAAQKIRAGTVWINTYRAFGAMMPFGGMKRSGHGRENGRWALEEFMQTKSYWLSYSDSEPEPFLIG